MGWDGYKLSEVRLVRLGWVGHKLSWVGLDISLVRLGWVKLKIRLRTGYFEDEVG